MKPTFLGIGAHKAGTTWLSEVLRSHPGIYMAQVKEIHYFTRYRDNGDDWYLSHFPSKEGAQAVGEFSTDYLANGNQVADRIHRFESTLKIVAVVRDPVRRAFSHYRWLVQKGAVKEAFLDAFASLPELKERGLYFRNFSQYWKLFPDENILIIRYDDISDDPSGVQRRVYEFLGVNPEFISPYTNTVVSKTINPRIQGVEDIRRKIFHYLQTRRMAFFINLIKKFGFSGLYRNLNEDRSKIRELSQTEYSTVYPAFADDLEKFAERTGLDLNAWKPRKT